MKILVINAGSSSIKYQLYQMPEADVLAKGLVERIGDEGSGLSQTSNGVKHTLDKHIPNHHVGMELISYALVDSDFSVLDDIKEIKAVGHRVVHGGEEFTGSVVINNKVIESIEKFADLAPLHNPPNLIGIKAAMEKLPHVPQIACFDTAFHASIPKTAYLYALPYELYEKYKIRRYGFHGTSHLYVSRRCSELMEKKPEESNIITCHLGNGCSLTAVKNGKSVETSMGLTPLEGLVMGTRCGDVDPAILFYLARKGYDIEQMKAMCNKESGLLGISGKSNDMRNLMELSQQGDSRSHLAIEIFCYRIRKYIGAYTAVLGRLDAVVFTGGIGENNPSIRADVCSDLQQIGIDVDKDKNSQIKGCEAEITTDNSRVKVFVIPTDEEGVIAQDTYRITNSSG